MSDMVNHPAHYRHYSVEVIDIIDQMNFCVGSAVKYILRSPFKGPDEARDLVKKRRLKPEEVEAYAKQKYVEDLEKSVVYLRRIKDEGISAEINLVEYALLHRVAREVTIENLRQAILFIAEENIDWAIKELEAAIKEEKEND